MKNWFHQRGDLTVSRAIKQPPRGSLKVSLTPCGLVVSLNWKKSFEMASDIYSLFFFFLPLLSCDHQLNGLIRAFAGIRKRDREGKKKHLLVILWHQRMQLLAARLKGCMCAVYLAWRWSMQGYHAPRLWPTWLRYLSPWSWLPWLQNRC